MSTTGRDKSGGMIDLATTGDTFCHEALFYEGDRGFVDATVPFIRGGVEAGEPVLVVVSEEKIDRLRAELHGDADRVRFADMARVGRNPATIIPAWREFVDGNAVEGRRMRGIGEPIWAGRTPDELVECHLHESLLNLAFSGSPMWLACPYDVLALGPAVIEEARRTHPVVSAPTGRSRSDWYTGIPTSGLDSPLPEPQGEVCTLLFGDGSLAAARAEVTEQARLAGIGADRATELVVAVNEVATNSIRYGGGMGTLRMWRDEREFICEVRDRGRIQNLLAGRAQPGQSEHGGYGLWLVNHMCDLVQVRSFGDEGVVRLHMNL
ncbi:MAG: anti-sigma factor RsbA family regulatory protein [Actinomycetota bacterium]